MKDAHVHNKNFTRFHIGKFVKENDFISNRGYNECRHQVKLSDVETENYNADI